MHMFCECVVLLDCHQLLLDVLKPSFHWENLLKPITQITAEAFLIQMLCSYIRNVPANAFGII